MKRANIIVHGTVQGVFFRANVKMMAERLGINGYARNLPDGTVEVVAEAPEDKLKELIEYCRKGPERAEVGKIEVKFSKAFGEFNSFNIMH